MAEVTFDDLVQFASESGWGQLAEPPVVASVTEGTKWEIPIWVDPGEGNTIDLTGATVTAAVLTKIDGDPLVEFTAGAWQATGQGTNYCLLTAEAADTANTGGVGQYDRSFPFHCTLTDGTDVVAFCGVQWSRIVINQGV